MDQNMYVIFISYHENLDESFFIAEELKEYYEKWGLRCVLIKDKRSISDPRQTIAKALGETDFLLQLYTNDPSPTDWMQREWEQYEIIRMSKNMKENRAVLHTKDTNLNDPFFEKFIKKGKSGELLVWQIDDEKDCRVAVETILEHSKRLVEPHGKVVLPEFCLSRIPHLRGLRSSQVANFFHNFYEANLKGLECVYPDRLAALGSVEQKINSLREGEKVRMLGITLKRYVLPDPEHPKSTGKYFESAIERGAEADLLQLNPKCPAAKHRAEIETPDKAYEKSTLFTEGEAVRSFYKNKPEFNGKVKIEFYDFPYVGILLFKDEIYIELYHVGKELQFPNICGHVPILVARKDSDFYKLFESHFVSLWPKKEGI